MKVNSKSASCIPRIVQLRSKRDLSQQQYLVTRVSPQIRCHILSKGLDLEILGEIAPGAFHYGMTCLVEFEPHSLWYEVSLTIAAQALKNGIKTEYHVFQHTPQEIRAALRDMSLNVEEYEERNRFRIMDSYTPTTPLQPSIEGKREPLLSGRNPDLTQWTKMIRDKMENGFEEEEKRWLHIDDNEGILLQFNDEDYVTKGWRTTFVPMAKSRDLLTIHAFVTGIASPTFYKNRETVADAIVDIKAEDKRGKLEHYIRLRALRGTKFDSTWRRIELFGKNQVRLASGREAFGFESELAERIFDYLVNSFSSDHYTQKLSMEVSGWRSMVDIAKNIGESQTSLYSTRSSILLGDLIKQGALERKFFSKERGRGGSVAKIRVAFHNESVRELIERRSRATS